MIRSFGAARISGMSKYGNSTPALLPRAEPKKIGKHLPSWSRIARRRSAGALCLSARRQRIDEVAGPPAVGAQAEREQADAGYQRDPEQRLRHRCLQAA